jgi:hypothetical protein
VSKEKNMINISVEYTRDDEGIRICIGDSMKRQGIYAPLKQQTNWKTSKQRSQSELANSGTNGRVGITQVSDVLLTGDVAYGPMHYLRRHYYRF